MRNLSIRIIAIALIGALVLVGSAEGQTSTNPAYTEKATAISFPATIGLLAFEGTEDYGDERYGVGIKYSTNGVAATLYVYNAGLKAIPAGAESPVHKDAMDMAVNDIKGVSRQGQYQDAVFGREEVAELAGRTGGHRARHISMAYTFQGTRWHSHIFVLGYKNRLVKLRFSYVDELRTTGEEQLEALTKWLDGALK